MRKKCCLIISILLLAMGNFLDVSNATTINNTNYYGNYMNSSSSTYGNFYSYEEENIRDYNIEIYVNDDDTMEITENITVYAKGNEIKHGIYRDFPTEYENKKVTFDLEEVLLDGKDVDYSLSGITRGIRIKIGDENEYLSEGIYTYTIKYTTERIISYYDGYDELYWNLIGSGWEFPIEHCYAKIYFPEETEFIEEGLSVYTGEYGEKGNSVDTQYNILEDENAIEIETIGTLDSNEAFTVAITFEKGAIAEPSFLKKASWFFLDNLISILILFFLLILIIWQYNQWKKYGKDPEKRVIIPKYFPPEGFSVADVKYIKSMGKTQKILEASILNLAVKGYFKLEENKQKNIIIRKTDKEINNEELTEFEYQIYEKFSEEEVLKYSSAFQSKLQSLNNLAKDILKQKCEGRFFMKNTKKIMQSIIASFVLVIVSLIIGGFYNSFAMSQYLENLMICVPIAYVISFISIIAISSIGSSKINFFYKLLIIVAFCIPFVAFLIGMIFAALFTIPSFLIEAFIVLAIFIDNYAFGKLIVRYTEEGQRVKEDIEGFEMFVNMAKDDDFADKTPEMFDKYFPYAYVLGVENNWAKKFENVLATANYSPDWCTTYIMTNGRFHATVFARDFSKSFSSGMSSASTAPSSSGGSGGSFGGGSSGGGRWRPAAGGGW